MIVIMMMVVVPVVSRSHANSNAAMMMMMVVMADHNLGDLDAAGLGEPRIIGFQKWHCIGDGIEKIAVACGLRDFQSARGRRLGASQCGQRRSRS